jgi:hypothetical protein
VVVLIDEAHAMPAETLEEIRLLSNLESNRHKLLQIVLFGQPELNEVLNRTEMRQLKERITHNFTLEPLVRADVAQYINFRMRTAGYKGPDLFSPSALKRIASASLGLTRRINILCDKALLAAFAGNTHQITVAHVKAAIRDAEPRPPWRAPDLAVRWRPWSSAPSRLPLPVGRAAPGRHSRSAARLTLPVAAAPVALPCRPCRRPLPPWNPRYRRRPLPVYRLPRRPRPLLQPAEPRCRRASRLMARPPPSPPSQRGRPRQGPASPLGH